MGKYAVLYRFRVTPWERYGPAAAASINRRPIWGSSTSSSISAASKGLTLHTATPWDRG